MNISNSTPVHIALSLAGSTFAHAAHAQDADVEVATTDNQDDELVDKDAIVVMATRRAGTVQDVPIGV